MAATKGVGCPHPTAPDWGKALGVVTQGDRGRAERLRRVIAVLLERGELQRGHYAQLASLYGVSRERVRQLAAEVKLSLIGLGREHGCEEGD
jgi:hypothetical protein